MKPYKLNLKRIIDTATKLEGKKVSINRAQMSEARRCIFAAIWEDFSVASKNTKNAPQWLMAFMGKCMTDSVSFSKPKPARRRHK